MFFSSLTVCFVSLAQLGTGRYTLIDDYTPENFFSMFTFFTGHDPTNGFVDYVDQPTANRTGLIESTWSSVYIGVDHTNMTPNGRPSVRITSNKSYNYGLIVLDLEHMPYGCGTWPAFWTVGPNWPNNGEIDIIEGVHDQTTNLMTLHTSDNCSITNDNMFTGSISTTNCFVNAPDQSNNAGSSIHTTNTQTYGAAFDAITGGVYATEWTSDAISIWFFPRNTIPDDIRNGHPNPQSWGEPVSQFQGACDLDTHIKDQQIVFDNTFCGDWAGNVWTSDATCGPQAATCNDFVANNPDAFTDAYWTINSLRIYQDQAQRHVHVGYPGHAPWGVDPHLPPWISHLAPIPPSPTGI
ncbi:hypothetical protein LTR74_018085 [Friedmanniomyces endolithicus]|nr:hypothetical protein LTR74_018085 [Friedmanniomyces endolithicus]